MCNKKSKNQLFSWPKLSKVILVIAVTQICSSLPANAQVANEPGSWARAIWTEAREATREVRTEAHRLWELTAEARTIARDFLQRMATQVNGITTIGAARGQSEVIIRSTQAAVAGGRETAGVQMVSQLAANNPRERVPQVCNVSTVGDARAVIALQHALMAQGIAWQFSNRGLGDNADFGGPAGTAARTQRACRDFVRDPRFCPPTGGAAAAASPTGNYQFITNINNITQIQYVANINTITAASPAPQRAFVQVMQVMDNMLARPTPIPVSQIATPAGLTYMDAWRAAYSRESVLMASVGNFIAYFAMPDATDPANAPFINAGKQACQAAQNLQIASAAGLDCTKGASLYMVEEWEAKALCTGGSLAQSIQNGAISAENRAILQSCAIAKNNFDMKLVAMRSEFNQAIMALRDVAADYAESGGVIVPTGGSDGLSPSLDQGRSADAGGKVKKSVSQAQTAVTQAVEPSSAIKELAAEKVHLMMQPLDSSLYGSLPQAMEQ